MGTDPGRQLLTRENPHDVKIDSGGGQPFGEQAGTAVVGVLDCEHFDFHDDDATHAFEGGTARNAVVTSKTYRNCATGARDLTRWAHRTGR
jgi:hypothetical protein